MRLLLSCTLLASIALSACFGEATLSETATPQQAEAVSSQDAPLAASAPADQPVIESWPAHGTAGVPTDLALVALHLPHTPVEAAASVGAAFSLRDAADMPVDMALESTACSSFGWLEGACLVLRPLSELLPHSTYAVTYAGDRDHRPWRAELRTGSGPQQSAATWQPPACLLDEQALQPGCALIEDTRIFLRLGSDQPTWWRLQSSSSLALANAVAPRGDVLLELSGLLPQQSLSATLILTDLAGLERRSTLTLTTAASLATLSISEVRADPRGAEPAQEYVEVLNFGDQPLSLQGFQLSSDPQARGDLIEDSGLVPAGGRALLVADDFDPEDSLDDPTPPGTPLLRIGTSLGSSGLSNQGQVIVLRDAAGQRLSAAPARPAPRAGVCLVRRLPELRQGLPANFGYDGAAGCTPGLPDRLPNP